MTVLIQQFIFYGLWVLPILLEAVLIVLLWRRSLQVRFPWFTAYLGVDLVFSSSLIAIYTLGNRPLYTVAYTAYVVAGAVLVFGALFEVVKDTFARLPELLRLQRIILGWAAVLILIVTIVLSFTSDASEGPVAVQVALTLERGVRLSQFLLILLLLAVSRLVRVAWSSLPAGIVIGFGVFAGFDLLLLILHSRWGKDYPFLFHVLRGMAANLQSLIWIVWVKWHAVPAESGMQLLFTTDPLVLQWEKGLAHFHGRQSSYISDLQSVVDRVMQEHDRSRND